MRLSPVPYKARYGFLADGTGMIVNTHGIAAGGNRHGQTMSTLQVDGWLPMADGDGPRNNGSADLTVATNATASAANAVTTTGTKGIEATVRAMATTALQVRPRRDAAEDSLTDAIRS